jgi:hypothetical protein
MDELRKSVEAVRESQIRMEADLKHHIKRTDLLESMITPIHKLRVFVQYLVIVAGGSLTLFGLLQLLRTP